MRARFVSGLVIYAGTLFTLLSLARNETSTDTWSPIPLIAVLAVAACAMWLRNRIFPSTRTASQLSNGSGSAAGRAVRRERWLAKVRDPWTVVTASFVVGFFLPSLLLSPGPDDSSQTILRIAKGAGYWAIFILTSAILLIRPLTGTRAKVAHWWLPNISLVILTWAAWRLLPNLYIAMAQVADKGPVTLEPGYLLVPLAALAWRALAQVPAELKD